MEAVVGVASAGVLVGGVAKLELVGRDASGVRVSAPAKCLLRGRL